MLPKDYINYKLTGVHCTDYSDASGMLLLDVQHKCWSKEMLDICGVSEAKMPKLFESWEPVGTLTAEAAVSLLAFLIFSIVSPSASFRSFPSAVAFCCAFFNPASAVVASTPFASNCASKFTEDVRSRPISFNVAPLVCNVFCSVSMEIPVSCPAFVLQRLLMLKTLF